MGAGVLRSGGSGVVVRRVAVWTAAAVVLSALACGCSRGGRGSFEPAERAASSPAVERLRAGAADANLIIIVLDAARADHLGIYGYGRDTTPNVDEFFGDSIVFEEAYCQAPNTKASVTSLFTSQFPDTHGVIGMLVALPSEVPVLAETLETSGFRTVCFSANPFVSSEFGFERGFDEFYEIFREVGLRANELGQVPAELLGKAAAAWFQEHGEERFFAYLHFLEPHQPYAPPEPFRSKYRGRRGRERLMAFYDGNLAYGDSVVGEVLSELERLGLLEKSLVVFLSDHGEVFGEHGWFNHAYTVYQGAIRVPLAVRLPAACGAEPQRRSEIISITDLMPTLLDLLGAGLPATMQGRSWLGLLAGESEAEPRYAVSRSRGTDESGGLQRPEEVTYALTAPRYTLILGNRGKRVELYDRESDPGQRRNIASQRRQLAEDLHQDFEEWARGQRGRPVVLRGGRVFASEERVVEMGERTRERLKALGYLK